MKHEKLILEGKITDSMIKIDQRMLNVKKPMKKELKEIIFKTYDELLDLCITANNLRGSKRTTVQNKMDVKIEKIRAFLDCGARMKLISTGLYKEWYSEVDEIGRLLGKWKESGKSV